MRLFATHSFGALSIFHPDLYRRPPREPADLALVTGRLAILFYMKSSNLSFEKLTRKNIKQARNWIRHWLTGARLRGRNKYREFDVGWDDIDDIVVVSVVDGSEAQCLAHLDSLVENPKIAFVATVGGAVLARLAAIAGNTRDLLQFLDALASDGEPVSIEAGLAMLTASHDVAFEPLRDYLKTKGETSRMGDLPAKYVFEIVRGIKPSQGIVELNMDWYDIGFLTWSAVQLVDGMAKPGEFGHIIGLSQKIDGAYRFGIAVSATLAAMVEKPEMMTAMQNYDLHAMFYLWMLEDKVLGGMVTQRPPEEVPIFRFDEIVDLRRHRELRCRPSDKPT